MFRADMHLAKGRIQVDLADQDPFIWVLLPYIVNTMEDPNKTPTKKARFHQLFIDHAIPGMS